MGKVTTQFTMSLDGFIAGPNDEVDPLMGWYMGGDTEFPVPGTEMTFTIARASAELLRQEWSTLGAIVTGRRDFDVSQAWGGEAFMGLPLFIVTHHPPPEWTGPDSPFTFVTTSVADALAQARQAAGDKNIGVSGTTIVQQCLAAGLLDEIRIDLAPILLGAGIRLFAHLDDAPVDLELIGLVQGQGVTHLQYRVLR